jgi:hypothetical protein
VRDRAESVLTNRFVGNLQGALTPDANLARHRT